MCIVIVWPFISDVWIWVKSRLFLNMSIKKILNPQIGSLPLKLD